MRIQQKESFQPFPGYHTGVPRGALRLPGSACSDPENFGSSPEMDTMFHEVDPVLFLIPLKGGFRQVYIKMLKHKYLLPVSLYTEMAQIAIHFVLRFVCCCKNVNGPSFQRIRSHCFTSFNSLLLIQKTAVTRSLITAAHWFNIQFA